MKEKTILYIVSDVRSGSTLLENILSKSKETTSVGELHHINSYLNQGEIGKTINWVCSCKKHLQSCPFWKKVFLGLNVDNIKDLENTRILFAKKLDETQILANKRKINIINLIYERIFEVTGNKLIIDSSKRPYHGLSLYQNIESKVKIIYLKRDLRAIAISKRKWNLKMKKEKLNLIRVLWRTYNYRMHCEKNLKQVNREDLFVLTYDELIKNTQLKINEMAEFSEISTFKAPKYMELEEDHTIGGTPNKFKKRKIIYDDSWQKVSKKNILFNILGKILNKIS